MLFNDGDFEEYRLHDLLSIIIHGNTIDQDIFRMQRYVSINYTGEHPPQPNQRTLLTLIRFFEGYLAPLGTPNQRTTLHRALLDIFNHNYIASLQLPENSYTGPIHRSNLDLDSQDSDATLSIISDSSGTINTNDHTSESSQSLESSQSRFGS